MAACSLSASLSTLTFSSSSNARGKSITFSEHFGTSVKSLRASFVQRSVSVSQRNSLVVQASTVESLLEEPVAERKYPPFAAFKIHGTGRRKTAVARVGMIEGTGNIIVNDLPLRDYFQNQALMIQAVRLPLASLGYENKFDIVIKAHGGGLSAQSQAMVLGIARALVKTNEANRPPLKAQGMLTRDSRAVERKKYGLKKARKAPQFSKR